MNFKTKVEKVQAIQWLDKDPELIGDFAKDLFVGFQNGYPTIVQSGVYISIPLNHWLVKRADGRLKVYNNFDFEERFELDSSQDVETEEVIMKSNFLEPDNPLLPPNGDNGQLDETLVDESESKGKKKP